jgi:hypothetical protein
MKQIRGSNQIMPGTVTNDRLAAMPAFTVKGNKSDAVATPTDLTAVDLGALGLVSASNFISEALFGIIDGVNKEFFATRVFQGGTALVSINGLEQILDTDYTEFPLDKKIVFSDPPSNVGFADVLHIRYFAV